MAEIYSSLEELHCKHIGVCRGKVGACVDGPYKDQNTGNDIIDLEYSYPILNVVTFGGKHEYSERQQCAKDANSNVIREINALIVELEKHCDRLFWATETGTVKL